MTAPPKTVPFWTQKLSTFLGEKTNESRSLQKIIMSFEPTKKKRVLNGAFLLNRQWLIKMISWKSLLTQWGFLFHTQTLHPPIQDLSSPDAPRRHPQSRQNPRASDLWRGKTVHFQLQAPRARCIGWRNLPTSAHWPRPTSWGILMPIRQRVLEHQPSCWRSSMNGYEKGNVICYFRYPLESLPIPLAPFQTTGSWISRTAEGLV